MVPKKFHFTVLALPTVLIMSPMSTLNLEFTHTWKRMWLGGNHSPKQCTHLRSPSRVALASSRVAFSMCRDSLWNTKSKLDSCIVYMMMIHVISRVTNDVMSEVGRWWGMTIFRVFYRWLVEMSRSGHRITMLCSKARATAWRECFFSSFHKILIGRLVLFLLSWVNVDQNLITAVKCIEIPWKM